MISDSSKNEIDFSASDVKRGSVATFAFLIFVLVSLGYIFSPVRTQFDSRWAIPTALSIVKEGNADLDEFDDLIRKNDYYAIIRVRDRKYTLFPLSTYMFAVTPVAVLRLFLDDSEILARSGAIERDVASVLVGLAAVFVFLVAKRELRLPYAILLVFVFAFCTPAWSTASRALWQHGPSVLMIAIIVYLVVRADEDEGSSLIPLGVCLAASYTLRPTNFITLSVIGIYCLVRFGRRSIGLIAAGCVVAALFTIVNLLIYDHPLPPYFVMRILKPGLHMPEAIAGNLVSPARGLFIYSPVFLLCFIGVGLKIASSRMKDLDWAFVAILLFHLLMISLIPNWWAGHSFGPRFFTDVLPYLVYFLIPFLQYCQEAEGRKRTALLCTLLLLAVTSFLIHGKAATNWAPWEWNGSPANVDFHPERLWDWHDIQFLRTRGS